MPPEILQGEQPTPASDVYSLGATLYALVRGLAPFARTGEDNANVLAMMPSKDHHWTNAYGLIAVGIPIIGFVTWQHGPWVGLAVMIAGMSILRWPTISATTSMPGLTGWSWCATRSRTHCID